MPTTLTRSFMVPQQHEETAADSPIMAFAGELGSAAPAAAAPPAPGDGSVAGDPGSAGSGTAGTTPLSARLHATVLDATKAELLPHPDFMLTEGTIIPCTLQTAINSELAGYVKCIIPQDIRSTTGDVVLLDKGTTVVGEIQQGLVQGQDRLFILWDRAETPDHAVIDLSSPGTDELGRAGVPGAVNNHFWERFGSAIMLSIIQGALQAGTAYAANSGDSSGGSTTETFFNQFQSNGSELANTALLNSVNIPPTLEKNQGDNVAIFVAKDLDFSDVYTLRVTGDSYGQ
jgi:type IV secretion system protein VirB10